MRQPTGDDTLAGYVRQSIADIVPTATLRAAPINAEYNKLRDAFAVSSGHKHDGSTGEGGYIPLIGDVDALNKVSINTNNNTVGVFVEVSSAAVEQVRFQDGVILPVTTNDIDLGSTSAKFKDLHLQGTATLATVDINAGNIDGTIIGASSPTSATFTSATLNNNLSVTGTSTLVGTTTITSVDLNSGAIDNAVIGSATPAAGTFTTLNANTSLVAATADINGGTIDGAALGATTPSTGSFTTLGASGTSTLATVDINGGNIDGTIIGASTAATGSFTTLSTSGQATLASADINGGSIDGATVGASTASTGAFTTLSSSGGITGNLTGNVTGNTAGVHTGNVTGNVTGNLTGNVTAGSGTSTFTNVVVNGNLNMNAGTSATITNLTAPSSDLDAATKKYVDDEISTLIGDAGAGLDTLGELADALNDDDDFSTTVTNSIATKLPKAGGTMTGAIAMSTNKITGAGDPTSAQDVSTKAYTDAQRDTRVAKTGDTMSGALAMGNNKITGLATPTAGTDVTNKTYVDGILGSATAAATSATNAATSETNAATSATSSANSAAAALVSQNAAAASYDNFDDRYLGAKSSAPTVDNDGDALITGALYFNSTTNIMNVYGSGGWQSAGSAVNGTSERNTYTATAGQTVFAATYDTGYIDVFLNGVKLLSGTDFTATNGTSITLASGASVNDVVDIVAYGTFELADHYTRTASDARYVQPTHTGNLDITGTVTSDGLTVDGSSQTTSLLVNTGSTAWADSNADDLIIRGADVGITISSSATGGINFGDSTSATKQGQITYTHSGDNLDFYTATNKRLGIAGNGDISFYEDTGTTAKFFWDASAESLGIGTSSPSAPLTLSGTGASSAFATFNSGNTADITSYSARAALELISYQSDGGSPYTKTSAIIANGDGTVPSEMQFWTKTNGQSSPAERMRLDSSGNVLVGKTGSNLFTVGAELTSTGQVYATASSAPTARFNRKTSDGEIVDFRKDDTTVGSIGTVDGDLNVFASASGHKGLRFGNGYIAPTSNSTSIQDATTDLGLSTHRFKDLYLSGLAYTNKVVTQTVFREGSDGSGLHFTTNAIYPTDQTSAVSNGTESLGAANYRFKDLYLGGGVYLGGTGSANKLSDYEEGTWTPTLHDNVGGSISLGTAYYTKVGRIVQVRINNYNNSNFSTLNASGALRISGFPFAGTGGAVPFGTNNPNNLNLLLDISGTSSWLWNGNGAVDFSFGNKGSIGLGTGAASMRGIVTYQAS